MLKIIKAKKQRPSLLLKVAIFAFSVYVLAALINQQVQISQKSQELDDISQQIQEQQVENEKIRHILEDSAEQTDEYVEQYVRENLDFAKPGEQVFENIAGK